MTKIMWVGYEYDIGEEAYRQSTTSPPLYVFDDLDTANKWKKLGKDRMLKKLYITQRVKCHTCDSEL